jgi:hypothetical protein
MNAKKGMSIRGRQRDDERDDHHDDDHAGGDVVER